MISQQKILKLEIEQLKNLRGLVDDNAVKFTDNGLTAIMGMNGCGKSTILHALACCYKPLISNDIDYKFSNFFLPNTDSRWAGSRFSLEYEYRNSSEIVSDSTVYTKQSDRWSPKYSRRPQRYVRFIGIKTCVPRIEYETKTTFYHYTTEAQSDDVSKIILSKAGAILNRDYTGYNLHTSPTGVTFLGVKHGDLQYSALSMGAGEQRLFFILSVVFGAPKNSLILIDEIDLLLHTDALLKLLTVLISYSINKKLQIVFTTHRESILDAKLPIGIRHILQLDDRTLCFNETKPDAIQRLTGVPLRPVEIFVEDDVSRAMIQKIASSLGLKKYISVRQYGAAINCFTVAAGIVLQDQNIENILFVLDGDVYRDEKSKKDVIKKILTGTDSKLEACRERVFSRIVQFQIPESESPESWIHAILVRIEPRDAEEKEIIESAKSIVRSLNSHDYLDKIFEDIGIDRSAGVAKIIDIVSSTPEWERATEEIRSWLGSKSSMLKERVG